MALVAVKAADRQSINSFGALLTQLGARGGQLIPAADEFLVKNSGRLKRCSDPYKKPDSSSKAKVDSGKITSEDGAAINLGTNEKELVKDISVRLAIDEVEAALLLRALRRHLGEQETEDVTVSRSKDDSFWETLTAFFFEERLAIIHVLAHILRSVDREGQISPDIYATIVADVAQPTFAKGLLDRVVYLATTPMPSTSTPFTSFWAKQYVREQKALLEVYFLLHYNKIFPNGQSLLDVLGAVKQTEWGCKQINEGYFDLDAYAIARDVTYLLMLVCIESLNLERASAPGVNELAIVPDATLAADDLLHPTMLRKLHNEILDIATSQPQYSGPPLLAWSFVLSRITESMTSVPLPETYYEVASEILPLELHPRRNVEYASANKSNQPVYQQIASHALSPNVGLLPTVYTLLSSSLLLSSSTSSTSAQASFDPNVPGYLSVARSLVSVLPLLVHPSFLPPADFDALVAVMQVLYANPAAGLLRGQFWGHYDQPEEQIFQGEWEIVEVAKSRFPVQKGQFLQLIKALTGGPSRDGADADDAQLARTCSERIKEYLASVSTLTQALPPMSSVLPLPYEASTAMDAGPLDVVSLRPIPVSPSVSVPANVPGRFVSEQDRRPIIISWDLSASRAGGFSAWRLLGDMLDAFVGTRKSASSRRQQQASNAVDVFSGGKSEDAPPVTWNSEEEQMQDIAAILEIIRDVLSNRPSNTSDTLTLLSSKSEEDTVQTFLSILEKATAMPSIPEHVTIPATQILQSLIRRYPEQIWNHVRSSGVLFPLESATHTPAWGSRTNISTRSTLVQNKSSGTYGQTLASIDFIISLVKHAHITAITDSVAMSEMKSDVLKRAIRWCMDSLWTSFSSWRFSEVGQRYEMGSKLAKLFQLVLADVDCAAAGRAKPLQASADFVLNTLLVQSSSARLAPLITAIASGLHSVSFMSRAGRHTDALASEEYTKASLSIIHRLLSLSRRVLPTQPTLLEKILFSHTNDKVLSSILSASGTGEDLIAIFFRYVHMAPNASLGVYAARVLSQLCRLSLDWGESSDRPSLLGHLGGVKETQKTIEALLMVAGDPFVEAGVQRATWELMTNIVEAQPGLADVLISGQKALVQLIAPAAADEADGNTGTTLANQVLEGWQEAWEAQPELLSAALIFLCAVWENYVDSNTTLHKLRKDDKIWGSLGKLLNKAVEPHPESLLLEGMDADEDLEVQFGRCCYRKSAKAAAARFLALDVQYAISRTEQGKAVQDASLKVLSDMLASKDAFQSAVLEATSSQFDPSLISDTQEAFSDTFRGLQLDAYQVLATHRSLGKEYGKEFFYTSAILEDRFTGLSDNLEEVAINNAISRVKVLNYAMSALDADSSLLAAWNTLLEVALPKVAESKAVGESLWTTIREVAKRAGEDSRTGWIAEEMHGERLRALKMMLEYASRRTVTAGPQDMPTMVGHIRSILMNESLDPLQSLKSQTASSFHRLAFQVAYLLFYKFATSLDKSTSIPREKSASLLSDTEACLGIAFSAVRLCTILASQTTNAVSQGITEDLSLSTALVQQILCTAIRPRPTVWLARCQELDLFRNLYEFVSSAPLTNGYDTMVLSVLELCSALAGIPQAAEKMALEGLVTCLNNNALTASLEEGTLQASSEEGHSVQHQIWCTMQAVMTQLVASLGSSVPFMENEVSAFTRLYSRQLYRCFRWTTNDLLTGSTLRELQNTATLFNTIISTRTTVQALQPILRKQINASLSLLQQLVYLLQHPNLLSTLLEPQSNEERVWLAGESDADANISLNDLHKRPVAASILQEVFKLCYTLIASLVTYTKAFTVLTRDTLDWPKDRAIVQANANVSLDEPATLGTLFDLARFCTDAVRYCNTSAPPTTTSSSPLPQYDPTFFLEMTANTLEATLLLMSTQIALTVYQQDALNGGLPSSDRAAQRARRDLKELAGDMVEEFLDRSSGTGGNITGDAGQEERNLMTVIKTFVLRL